MLEVALDEREGTGDEAVGGGVGPTARGVHVTRHRRRQPQGSQQKAEKGGIKKPSSNTNKFKLEGEKIEINLTTGGSAGKRKWPESRARRTVIGNVVCFGKGAQNSGFQLRDKEL